MTRQQRTVQNPERFGLDDYDHYCIYNFWESDYVQTLEQLLVNYLQQSNLKLRHSKLSQQLIKIRQKATAIICCERSRIDFLLEMLKKERKVKIKNQQQDQCQYLSIQMQGFRKMSIQNIIQKSFNREANKPSQGQLSPSPKEMTPIQLFLKQYIIESGAISSKKCSMGLTNLQKTGKQVKQQKSKLKPEKESKNDCQISICQIESVAISKMGIRNYDNMQNQDVILQDEIANKCKIYGIFDGHGQYGRTIAEAIKNIFRNFLTKYAQDIKNESSVFTIQAIVKKVLQKTNLYLLHYKAEQAQFSGATALIVIVTSNKIYSFNIGNSRVILAKYYQAQKSLAGFQLSHDHTISRFDERLRILSKNAVIEPYKNQRGEFIGPDRIWAPNQRYPGIYVTRTMGLSCAYKLGITSEVQVNVLPYKEYLKYIILGSDGLWRVFQNNQIVSILEKNVTNNLTAYANCIIFQALKRWRQKNELMDDVSLIIVRLVNE